MNTLKDVLLVFTVIMLVYVLYQRLLQVLGKKERSKRYARVSEQLQLQDGVLKMQLELDQAMVLKVTVHAASGEEVLKVDDRSLEAGAHAIEVDVTSLSQGRYYMQLQTPAEVYSRYFDLI
jgi:hypothetical protein